MPRLTSLWSYLRFAVGRPPRTIPETTLYLRHLVVRRRRPPAFLPMIWGPLAFTDVAITRSQFQEIFVERHYAFLPASGRPTIVDCGGNIGLSAIWFSQNYPGCHLTVYEADADLAKILRANLDAAGHAGAEVHNHAVWTADTELVFAATGADTGRIDPAGNRRVRAIDLARALPAEVDLLKLDIEGAEFDVLDHLVQTGAIARVRNAAIEFHPSQATYPRLMRLLGVLAASGFRICFQSSLGPYLGLEPQASPFETVGRNRMFIQAYLWRP